MPGRTSRWLLTAAPECNHRSITLRRNILVTSPACMTGHFTSGARAICRQKPLPQNRCYYIKCPGLWPGHFVFDGSAGLKHVPQELVVNVVVVLDLRGFYERSQQPGATVG